MESEIIEYEARIKSLRDNITDNEKKLKKLLDETSSLKRDIADANLRISELNLQIERDSKDLALLDAAPYWDDISISELKRRRDELEALKRGVSLETLTAGRRMERLEAKG